MSKLTKLEREEAEREKFHLTRLRRDHQLRPLYRMLQQEVDALLSRLDEILTESKSPSVSTLPTGKMVDWSYAENGQTP